MGGVHSATKNGVILLFPRWWTHITHHNGTTCIGMMWKHYVLIQEDNNILIWKWQENKMRQESGLCTVVSSNNINMPSCTSGPLLVLAQNHPKILCIHIAYSLIVDRRISSVWSNELLQKSTKLLDQTLFTYTNEVTTPSTSKEPSSLIKYLCIFILLNTVKWLIHNKKWLYLIPCLWRFPLSEKISLL